MVGQSCVNACLLCCLLLLFYCFFFYAALCERIKMYIIKYYIEICCLVVASLHRRLGIAGCIMAQLDNVWRQQRLSLSTKLTIYTSLVQCYMAPKRGQCAKQTATGSSLFTSRHCVVSLVSDGMTRYPTQKSMRERNYQTCVSYC